VVCESLVRLFIESGSENYLEIEMQKSQKDAMPEWYTLLIQKKTGMTPAQKNALLQSQVKELIEAVKHIKPFVEVVKEVDIETDYERAIFELFTLVAKIHPSEVKNE
jgi:hypothetical protein